MAVGRLFGQEEWNAESRLLHGVALQSVGGFGRESWRQSVGEGFLRPWVGAEGGPKHPDVLLVDVLSERFGDRHFTFLFSPTLFYLVVVPGHGAAQLSHLLLERHAAEKVGHASVGAQAGILIRWKVLGFRLRGREGACCCEAQRERQEDSFVHRSSFCWSYLLVSAL